MRSIFFSPNHAARWRWWRLVFWTTLAIMLLLLTYTVAAAQCVPNPTLETAVALRNTSSHYLTLYIDGERKDPVPPGDRSVNFIVEPGEHALIAEAIIGAESVFASRTVDIAEGYVCTWTVIDPQQTNVQGSQGAAKFPGNKSGGASIQTNRRWLKARRGARWRES